MRGFIRHLALALALLSAPGLAAATLSSDALSPAAAPHAEGLRVAAGDECPAASGKYCPSEAPKCWYGSETSMYKCCTRSAVTCSFGGSDWCCASGSRCGSAGTCVSG